MKTILFDLMKHVITQSFLKSLGSWRWLQWEWDAGRILPDAFVASYVLISPSFVFSGPSHLHRDWENWKPNWGRASLCGSWDSHLQARCVSLRCPSSAFPPHIPNLPLRCKLSANTALYDLKKEFKERMTKSLAGTQASEDMNYFS